MKKIYLAIFSFLLILTPAFASSVYLGVDDSGNFVISPSPTPFELVHQTSTPSPDICDSLISATTFNCSDYYSFIMTPTLVSFFYDDLGIYDVNESSVVAVPDLDNFNGVFPFMNLYLGYDDEGAFMIYVESSMVLSYLSSPSSSLLGDTFSSISVGIKDLILPYLLYFIGGIIVLIALFHLIKLCVSWFRNVGGREWRESDDFSGIDDDMWRDFEFYKAEGGELTPAQYWNKRGVKYRSFD